MSVITFSRLVGSLGREVAQKVSENLNYDYIDREKIGEALAEYGFPERELGLTEQKKPNWIFSFSINKEKFLHFLKGILYEFARKDNVVIFGMGAQIILKDLPNAYHARLIAPFDVRVKRIANKAGSAAAHAEHSVRSIDQDFYGWTRFLFGVDWNEPSLYDTMINTGKISEETAVQMVLQAVNSPELREMAQEGDNKIADLILEHRIEAILIEYGRDQIRDFDINLKGGIVTLTGEVNSERLLEKIGNQIAEIEGVKEVNNNLLARIKQYGVI